MKYTNEDLIYLSKFYSYEQKDVIMSQLPGHSWMSITDKARRHGYARPRTIRKPRLHVLLDDSILNAYWWGLIYSDGYLPERGKLVVQLWDKDREYLENFASYVKAPIYEVPKGMIRLEIQDKGSSKLLRSKLKMKDRKTYNPPDDFSFLSTPEMRLSFFIGFTDGDGCLTFDKNRTFKHLRIVVHESWLDFLTNLCLQLELDFGLKFTITQNGRGNSSVYMGSKYQHVQLYDFILENKLPALYRKWNNQGKGFNTNEHFNDRKAN